MREPERCAVRRDCDYIMFVTESARVEASRFCESLGYYAHAYQGFKKYLGNGQQDTGAGSQ